MMYWYDLPNAPTVEVSLRLYKLRNFIGVNADIINSKAFPFKIDPILEYDITHNS